jgi:hypothetical protein
MTVKLYAWVSSLLQFAPCSRGAQIPLRNRVQRFKVQCSKLTLELGSLSEPNLKI